MILTREQVRRVASYAMVPSPAFVRELARLVLAMDEELAKAEAGESIEARRRPRLAEGGDVVAGSSAP